MSSSSSSSSALATLLGTSSLLKGSATISVDQVATDAKYIGLYFSAHWCPPCKGFTPKLAAAYKDSLHSKGLEVIFLSSDKSQGEFSGYYGEMPWLALDFAHVDQKTRLSKHFKVRGIPTFVILDAKTCEVINGDARPKVESDPSGRAFPWKPLPVFEQFGEVPVAKFESGKASAPAETLAQVAARADVVGLYFSAHWCPPCKAFTPQLAGAYSELLKHPIADAEASHKTLEIVFVSSDEDEKQMSKYASTMPWKAIPFSNRDAIQALGEKFEVDGIPRLVFLDGKTGNVLVSNAVQTVSGNPKGFPWLPKPVDRLSMGTVDTVQDEECVMVFAGTEEAADRLVSELVPVVKGFYSDPELVKLGSKAIKFIVVGNENQLVKKIKTYTGGPSTPKVVGLNLSNGTCAPGSSSAGANVADVTVFFKGLLNGEYVRDPIRPKE